MKKALLIILLLLTCLFASGQRFNFNRIITYYDAGNSGSSITLDWNYGNFQKLTLTGDCTITLPSARTGIYYLQLVQDGTGSREPTISGVYWPDATTPVWTSAISGQDLITIICDGTYYYAQTKLNYGVYTPLSDYLIAYWKLNESSGNAADSSGNGYTLTATGDGVSYEAGKLNNCTNLAGTDDYFIKANPIGGLNFLSGSSWSVAAWVNADALAADSDIVSISTNAGANFELRYDAAILGTAYVTKWVANMPNSGTPTYVAAYDTTAAGDASTGEWVFLVATYSSGTALKLYINGIVCDVAPTDNFYAIVSSATLNIGCSTVGGIVRDWDGKIDNVMIFNKELTQQEIYEVYNGGNGTEDF